MGDSNQPNQYKLHLTAGRDGLSHSALRQIRPGQRKIILQNAYSQISRETVDEAVVRDEENINTQQSEIVQQPIETNAKERRELYDDDAEHENNVSQRNAPMDLEAEDVAMKNNDCNDWERLVEFNEFEIRKESTESELHDIKGFDDLLENQQFFSSLDKKITKSPGEILLMILTHCLHVFASFTAITNLLHCINVMVNQVILPETKHMLEKLLGLKNQNCQFHAMCLYCNNYIGRFESTQTAIECNICKKILDLSNPSCLNFFIIIDPCDYIANHLQENEEYYDDVMNGKYFSTNQIKDIYDGKRYRKFLAKLPPDVRKRYVTAVFSSDGAPCFESSTFSIWPIYLQLNELPPQERLKRIIVSGLYFGKEKPNMSTLFEPFVEKINEIMSNGFHVTIKGEQRLIRLFTLVACADAVARAPMQGIKQFNGHYGCAWCLHEGVYSAGSMRYPILNSSIPELRNKRSHLQDIHEAVRTKSCIHGVQTTSPLINLKYFDIIRGFIPDYMHFLLLGVVKQCLEYILEYITIPDKIAVLDKIILGLKIPHQLCRLTRSLSDRSHWKAKEWENFLLYYSVPLFKPYFDKKNLREKFEHWCLLVDSLHVLLSDSIEYEDLDEVHVKLITFVIKVERFYSIDAMTSNVHQLVHVVESVIDWGPLWAHSNFGFESANADLLKAIHSAKGVNLQIVRFIELQHKTRLLKKRVFPTSNILIRQFCENFDFPRIQKTFKSKVRYLGPEKPIETHLLLQFELSSDKTQAFAKILKDGVVFSHFDKSNERSCDSYAQLIDGRFVKCLHFVIDTQTNEEVTLVNFINVSETQYCKSIKTVISTADRIDKIASIQLRRACVFIEIQNYAYICPTVNSLYY